MDRKGDMTEQTLIATLLDIDDSRIDTVSEVESYLRSIRDSK
jgi:hypothetical protein